METEKRWKPIRRNHQTETAPSAANQTGYRNIHARRNNYSERIEEIYKVLCKC